MNPPLHHSRLPWWGRPAQRGDGWLLALLGLPLGILPAALVWIAAQALTGAQTCATEPLPQCPKELTP